MEPRRRSAEGKTRKGRRELGGTEAYTPRRRTGEVAVGVVPQRLPYKEMEIFLILKRSSKSFCN